MQSLVTIISFCLVAFILQQLAFIYCVQQPSSSLFSFQSECFTYSWQDREHKARQYKARCAIVVSSPPYSFHFISVFLSLFFSFHSPQPPASAQNGHINSFFFVYFSQRIGLFVLRLGLSSLNID